MTKIQQEQAEQLLKEYEIEANKYLIGIFQHGMTIYDQQIRAINLFHALYLTNQHFRKRSCTIAVIGGGIAGVTFAAMALKACYEVNLYERASELIHLQQGCDRREIYPYLYHWPDFKSEELDAKLPIVNWTKGTADNVAQQILNGFKSIQGTFDPSEISLLYGENLNSGKISSITYSKSKKKYLIQLTLAGKAHQTSCDIVVFAIGFGIEKAVDDDRQILSYWTSNANHQPILSGDAAKFNIQQNVFISGTGDGALIDLLNFKIKHFSYEKILEIIASHRQNSEILKARLARIKSLIENSQHTKNKVNLFDQLEQIKTPIVAYIYRYLIDNDLINKLNVIKLNGRKKEFNQIFDLKNASLLNLLLIYILKKFDEFEYIYGEFELDERTNKYFLDDGSGLKRTFDDHKIIIRHGTDKFALFHNINFFNTKKKNLDKLESIQKNATNNRLKNPLWTEDELEGIFATRSLEYYTNGSSLGHPLFVMFMNIISYTLNEIWNSKIIFRTTLYKIVPVQNRVYYQQVTSFMGLGLKPSEEEGLGYAHDQTKGNVGFSLQTGQISSLNITSKEEAYLESLGQTLKIANCVKKFTERTSYLAIPILSKVSVSKDRSGNKNEKAVTNLVIFLDSPHEQLTFSIETISKLVPLINGFVNSINELVAQNKLKMTVLENIPPITSPFALQNYCDLKGFKKILFPANKMLKFNEFCSFDFQ